jgi:hypothetical protein
MRRALKPGKRIGLRSDSDRRPAQLRRTRAQVGDILGPDTAVTGSPWGYAASTCSQPKSRPQASRYPREVRLGVVFDGDGAHCGHAAWRESPMKSLR